MSSEEFLEIGHAGGKVTVAAGGAGIEYVHAGGATCALFRVCVSYEGKLLDTIPMTGIGQEPIYPRPSIPVWIISDSEGFFGRSCPRCAKYFRTDAAPQFMFCPYCGRREKSVAFTTKNQMEYIESFANMLLDAVHKDQKTVVDIDAIVAGLSANKPLFAYSEEKQQSRYTCLRCKVHFDILGLYGICPHCALPNAPDVFHSRIDQLEMRFQKNDAELKDRHEREAAWVGLLKDAVSDFEALGRTIQARLVRIPMTPRRREAVSRISFQNIRTAASELDVWFGFKLLDGIREVDQTFIHRMFHRRHLFTHNAGVVDEEYVTATGDSTVRLGQVVRVGSDEIKRLLELIRVHGDRLIGECATIKSE